MPVLLHRVARRERVIPEPKVEVHAALKFESIFGRVRYENGGLN
jgi:hypothetical protein